MNHDIEPLQCNHYYPFGMRFNQSAAYTADAENRYLYNGNELQQDLGLDWYDYGARFYDASLCRFMRKDPDAEFAFAKSPYSYVSNNPIFFVDPDGRFETRFGAWLYSVFNGGEVVEATNGVYYVSEDIADLDGAEDGEVDVTCKVTWKWGQRSNNYGGGGVHFTTSRNSGFSGGNEQRRNDNAQSINIDALPIPYFGVSKANNLLGFLREASDVASKVVSIKDGFKSKSDKEKKKETKDPTDGDGKLLNGKETDSIKATYTIMFDEEKGNTYQDYKIHKHTKRGRVISEPYKKDNK